MKTIKNYPHAKQVLSDDLFNVFELLVEIVSKSAAYDVENISYDEDSNSLFMLWYETSHHCHNNRQKEGQCYDNFWADESENSIKRQFPYWYV